MKIATLLFLLQVAATPASPQSVEKASVEGVVLSSGSGEPLARAQVTLYRGVSREEWLAVFRDGEVPDANAPSMRTGNDGKFLLKDISPGAYRLTVTRNGYAEQTLGQKILDGPSTIFNLAPAQSVKNITVRMVQAGVITGRVRDASGEPVVGAGVTLMRSGYDSNGGKTVFGPIDGSATDDRGEYRFYWVPPGGYHVRVASKSRLRTKSSVVEPFIPVFYPGAVDLDKASSVEVQQGDELSTIDIVLPPSQGHRLRGRAVDAVTGKPPKWTEIRLSPKNRTTYDDDDSGLADYNPETGAFEIATVFPGSYWLTATVQSAENEQLSPEALANILDTPVVISAPPELLTVVLSNRGGQIEGNLTDAASQPVSFGEVILIPDQRDRKRLFKSTQSDLNGRFVFRALPPGSYKLFSWEGLEERAYYDPSVLARYENQGRSVRVEESSKQTAELRIIPAPNQ